MRKFAAVAIVMIASVAIPANEPKQPAPQKEHEWLSQLTGEWETDAELIFEPGKPPFKCKGTESVRSIGGFWVIGESKADMMGKTMTGIMTLGYDPEKKKYIGTWVDSNGSYLWKYVGTLDKAGKVLTLEADGPNPMAPDKLGKFRDVIEVKGKDHKVMTSSILGDDGKWVSFMTVNYRRKK